MYDMMILKKCVREAKTDATRIINMFRHSAKNGAVLRQPTNLVLPI